MITDKLSAQTTGALQALRLPFRVMAGKQYLQIFWTKTKSLLENAFRWQYKDGPSYDTLKARMGGRWWSQSIQTRHRFITDT